MPSLDAQDTEDSIRLTMITAGFWASGWQPPHGSPPHSLTGPTDMVMVDLSCTNKAQRLEELGRGYEDCKY